MCFSTAYKTPGGFLVIPSLIHDGIQFLVCNLLTLSNLQCKLERVTTRRWRCDCHGEAPRLVGALGPRAPTSNRRNQEILVHDWLITSHVA